MQEVFDKIIEKLDELIDCNPIDGYEKGKTCAVSEAVEIVKQAAAEYNNGWIPCSERLPDKYNHVLVCTDKGGYYIAHMNKRTKWVCTAECVSTVIENSNVIAWQPLPDPYHQSGEHKKKTNFDRCCESMESMAQIIDIAKIGWTKEQIMEWLQKEECPVPD